MANCNYETSSMMRGTGNNPESMYHLSQARAMVSSSAQSSISFFAQSFELSIIFSHVVAGIILSLFVVILSIILA